MTPLRDTLARLGLSQTRAARLIGVDDRTMRRWLEPPGAPGHRTMPVPVSRLMDLMERVPGARERLEALANAACEEGQDLIDARDHAMAMRDVAAGTLPTVADADVDAWLAAPTPLAFWRRQRGLTQAVMAEAAGVSQSYLAQLESGQRTADVRLYARLAACLGVRIEDLITDPGTVETAE